MPNTAHTLRIVSRKSALALCQSEFVKAALLHHYPHLDISIHGVSTLGDKITDQSLAKIGGKGLFVKELEEQLLNDQADIAVHSMKDVPAVLPEALEIACVLKRLDPRDVFISKTHSTLQSLPIGARVGTSSLRRQAQLYTLRRDLMLETLRGNVDTRIQKLENGEFDAIILAAAGLQRLKLEPKITEYFDPTQMLPAVGQGALGIECRKGDLQTQAWISILHDAFSGACVLAERSMNALLGGSCQLPVAGLATLSEGSLHLQGLVAKPDGSLILYAENHGLIDNAVSIGHNVAQQLLSKGAKAIMDAIV